MHKQPIAVLMGPTASGKSALALQIAQARPTVIINADAMQMVSALRIITARPSVEEEAQAEHALYGVLPATTPTSVALWLELVQPVICQAWAEGKLPLLVGGTGMYIAALMHGISKIPPIPEEVRQKVRSWVLGTRDWAEARIYSNAQQPAPSTHLHSILAARDPIMAGKLKPGDTQRICRALEVVEATGQSLDTWQKLGKHEVFPEAEFISFCIMPERKLLYQRIDQRFETMIDHGVIEEVRGLLALNLPPDLPILRATGVPEIAAYIKGILPYDEAITKAKQHSRNYAKRQMTWIRNQMPEAVLVEGAAQVIQKLGRYA